MKLRKLLWILVLSSGIVLGLELLTNSVDTQKNAWDFVYYIAMAKYGFHAQPMASPFAYRYLTPSLVHGLSLLGLSVEQGFGLIAYLGAIAQLAGIYYFVEWLAKSQKGAYLAMAVTALSLYNIKFLLFDIYRPDHLAYALILLQTYLAFRRKFLLLLILTAIASQIREFNMIPLIAYLLMRLGESDTSLMVKETIAAFMVLLLGILLPRMLIPVTENYELVSLTKRGLETALLLPLIPSFDLNLVFVTAAYFLPLLFLVDLSTIKKAFVRLPMDYRRYLSSYTVLVLVLTFFGGTDYFRFATFLFLPQIILIGLVAPAIPRLRSGFMLLSTFVFNRIWLNFPDWDVHKYRDFYGGYSPELNIVLLYRFLEYGAILLLGSWLRMRMPTAVLAESADVQP